MTVRLRPVLAAALFLFLWTVPLTVAGGPTALPAWGTEPSPNAGFPRNVLEDVDAVSVTDAWAVGSYEADGFLHPRPLVERWNGSEWSSIGVPWNQEGELLGVAALASGNVWMVGGNQDGGQAVIARWNGSALSLVPHPNPGPFNRPLRRHRAGRGRRLGRRGVHKLCLEDLHAPLGRILVDPRSVPEREWIQPPVRRDRARLERRLGGRRRRNHDAHPPLERIAVDARAGVELVVGDAALGFRSAGRDPLGGR
jgi:hypothetical protein